MGFIESLNKIGVHIPLSQTQLYQDIENHRSFLEKMGLSSKIKTDFDLFSYEIIYRGLLTKNKIENILSLRGDYPKDYDPKNTYHYFKYSSELNEFITKNYPDTFCLSGACYPEVHQEATSLENDLDALKKKVDAGAQYLITQIFFDNNYYYRLLREARIKGINVPIIAGIMPATNSKSLLKIAKLSGSNIPYNLSAMIERFKNNPKAMKEVGINYAVYQIIDLITNGVEGIHIYTMNRPEIAKEIIARIDNILKEFIND